MIFIKIILVHAFSFFAVCWLTMTLSEQTVTHFWITTHQLRSIALRYLILLAQMYQWFIDIKTLWSNASFSKCQASQQDLVLETDGNFNHYKTMLAFSVSLFNSTLTVLW